MGSNGWSERWFHLRLHHKSSILQKGDIPLTQSATIDKLQLVLPYQHIVVRMYLEELGKCGAEEQRSKICTLSMKGTNKAGLEALERTIAIVCFTSASCPPPEILSTLSVFIRDKGLAAMDCCGVMTLIRV
jgi:hypothetical protein